LCFGKVASLNHTKKFLIHIVRGENTTDLRGTKTKGPEKERVRRTVGRRGEQESDKNIVGANGK